MLRIKIDDRWILILYFQYRIYLWFIRRNNWSISCLQYPFHHIRGLYRCFCWWGIVCCQLPIAVEQLAVLFKTIPKDILNTQCTIIFTWRNSLGSKIVVCIIVEGIKTPCILITCIQIVNIITTIDWRDCSTTSDITIERTVHHHCLDTGCSGSTFVITYNTTYIISTCNIGIAIAVDDTGTTIERAH